MLPHEKMGIPSSKANLNISVQAEVFIRRERENRTKRSRNGCGHAGSVVHGPIKDFHGQLPVFGLLAYVSCIPVSGLLTLAKALRPACS